MKSRRTGDFVNVDPSLNSRNQQRVDSYIDRYPDSSRTGDGLDRSPRARRSLSPPKPDGLTRVMFGNHQRVGSTERREYGVYLGGGRSDRVRSRSPSYGQMRERPRYGEAVMQHMKYEFEEPVEFDVDAKSRMKQVYEYDRGISRNGKEKDYNEDKIVSNDRHAMLNQKLIPMENDTVRRPYRFSPDPFKYGDTDGKGSPPFVRNLGIGQAELERIRFNQPSSSDKHVSMESYRKGDKHMINSRDVSYNMVPTSQSRNFMSTSKYNDTVSSSSANLRDDVLVSYGDGVPMSASQEFPRSIRTPIEPVGYSKYGERALVNSVRDHEASRRNITSYQGHEYSPARAERDDYYHTEPEKRSSGLHRKVHSHSHLDYDHTPVDYDRRDLSRPSVMHPVGKTNYNDEESYGNMRNNSALDHSTSQKQTVSNHHDISRPYHLNHDQEYMGSRRSHIEFGRKSVQDIEISHMDLLKESQIPHQRSGFGFHRGLGPESRKQILQSSPVRRYESETHVPVKRAQRVKEDEVASYELSGRIPKRKYIMEEDMTMLSYKTNTPRKWNLTDQLEDPKNNEEWIDEDMLALHSSRRERLDNNDYRRTERTYNTRDQPGYTSNDRLSAQDSSPLGQRPSVKIYKQSDKYVKSHSRPGPSSWQNSYFNDRRSGIHNRNHKVWKRDDGYDEDVLENDVTTPRDRDSETEPSEDSEEFKQLVHEAFLNYSKKLGLNIALQRRYKELGNGGSLWCIVCGRSTSKEFMDTRRLTKHALMSHKVGSRAQHLGLHKALCVLMGWSTVLPLDVIAWAPTILPDKEALDEKEDLIIWPPVVIIHNISMSNNNPEEQKVIPVEAIKAYIRGKGIVGGSISLGKPSDQSIMVVKFLGTFSGLSSAEKLHKYFSNKKHGREDFGVTTSRNRKLKISAEVEVEAGEVEKIEEDDLLFGYMGVSEDLDRVDYNSKQWSFIKSKKEILDIANAPIKPDDVV